MTTDPKAHCAALAHSIEQLEAQVQREVAGLSEHQEFLEILQRLISDPEELMKHLAAADAVDKFGPQLAAVLRIPIAMIRLDQARRQLTATRSEIDD